MGVLTEGAGRWWRHVMQSWRPRTIPNQRPCRTHDSLWLDSAAKNCLRYHQVRLQAVVSATQRTRQRVPASPSVVSAPQRGEGWVHEIKFDGYRLLAVMADRHAELFTRAANEKRTFQAALRRLREAEGLQRRDRRRSGSPGG
jgi:hypothetical protein